MITQQQAIEILKNQTARQYETDLAYALDIAIKALEENELLQKEIKYLLEIIDEQEDDIEKLEYRIAELEDLVTEFKEWEL